MSDAPILPSSVSGEVSDAKAVETSDGDTGDAGSSSGSTGSWGGGDSGGFVPGGEISAADTVTWTTEDWAVAREGGNPNQHEAADEYVSPWDSSINDGEAGTEFAEFKQQEEGDSAVSASADGDAIEIGQYDTPPPGDEQAQADGSDDGRSDDGCGDDTESGSASGGIAPEANDQDDVGGKEQALVDKTATSQQPSNDQIATDTPPVAPQEVSDQAIVVEDASEQSLAKVQSAADTAVVVQEPISEQEVVDEATTQQTPADSRTVNVETDKTAQDQKLGEDTGAAESQTENQKAAEVIKDEADRLAQAQGAVDDAAASQKLADEQNVANDTVIAQTLNEDQRLTDDTASRLEQVDNQTTITSSEVETGTLVQDQKLAEEPEVIEDTAMQGLADDQDAVDAAKIETDRQVQDQKFADDAAAMQQQIEDQTAAEAVKAEADKLAQDQKLAEEQGAIEDAAMQGLADDQDAVDAAKIEADRQVQDQTFADDAAAVQQVKDQRAAETAIAEANTLAQDQIPFRDADVIEPSQKSETRGTVGDGSSSTNLENESPPPPPPPPPPGGGGSPDDGPASNDGGNPGNIRDQFAKTATEITSSRENADEATTYWAHRRESIQEDAVMLADQVSKHAKKHAHEFGLAESEFKSLIEQTIKRPDAYRSIGDKDLFYNSDKRCLVVLNEHDKKFGGSAFRAAPERFLTLE